jgi:hypothetical protein
MPMTDATTLPNSCAALTAQLVVEGCLPIIQGTVSGKAPIEGVVLTAPEREKLNLKSEGITIFYPAGETGVFFDMRENEFTLWFDGGDCDRATSALHDRLTKTFPTARQLDDVPHPRDQRMRARVYRVELGSGKLAAVKTSFGAGSRGSDKFVVHVVAQQRPS